MRREAITFDVNPTVQKVELMIPAKLSDMGRVISPTGPEIQPYPSTKQINTI